MNKICCRLAFVLAFSMAACSSPEAPPKNTKAHLRSGGETGERVADKGSWKPTDLTRAALTGERSTLARALGEPGAKPSLYDLHHPQGALALSGHIHGLLTLEILESAGRETAIDEVLGEFSLDGEKRSLWLHYDQTRLELPVTTRRWSLPPRVGIVSVTEQGVQRLSDGESMAVPARPGELARFAAKWADEVGVAAPPYAAGKRLVPSRELMILPDEVMFDGVSFDIKGFADELELTLDPQTPHTLTLIPDADSGYGDLVALLAELYDASESGVDLRFALPLPGEEDAQVHELRFDPILEPIMVLKADRRTPWSRIGTILGDLAKSLPEVLLMTHLDVSDPKAVTDQTLLGGLPGGLPLRLAPVLEGGEKIFVERGELFLDFEDESFGVEDYEAGDYEAESADSRSTAQRRVPRNTPPQMPAPEDLGPIHVGGDVSAPVLISRPDPVYTEPARQAGLQGLVIIQAVIDKNGSVTQAKILKGLPHGLSDAALRAVKASRYEPAMKNGAAVDVYFNVVVRFEHES